MSSVITGLGYDHTWYLSLSIFVVTKKFITFTRQSTNTRKRYLIATVLKRIG